jgi:hypothetical protein
MRKISRSDQFPKQAKNQLVKGHVAPSRDDMWQWKMMIGGNGHMAGSFVD